MAGDWGTAFDNELFKHYRAPRSQNGVAEPPVFTVCNFKSERGKINDRPQALTYLTPIPQTNGILK
jgi:hypothetical protein